ncbi:unnamed protein product [Amoebophrya sp. A120]|nr:unnamed protein product [Amoebophrya sp. A120]|eukprot:GSA120T00005671001.1
MDSVVQADLEHQKNFKQSQLEVLPAAVVLTFLVSGGYVSVGFFLYFKNYLFEAMFAAFWSVVFITYHVHEVNAKVSAPYTDLYAPGKHFNLDVQSWQKLETTFSVFGLLLVINHSMCNVYPFSDEVFQALSFILLLYVFEVETSTKYDNAIFIPVIIGLFIFLVKLLLLCRSEEEDDLERKQMGCAFAIWILCIIYYGTTRILMSFHDSEEERNKNVVLQPERHFLALLICVAILVSVQSVEKTKKRFEKQRINRSRRHGNNPWGGPRGRRSRNLALGAEEGTSLQSWVEDSSNAPGGSGPDEPYETDVQRKLDMFASTPIGMQRISPGADEEEEIHAAENEDEGEEVMDPDAQIGNSGFDPFALPASGPPRPELSAPPAIQTSAALVPSLAAPAPVVDLLEVKSASDEEEETISLAPPSVAADRLDDVAANASALPGIVGQPQRMESKSKESSLNEDAPPEVPVLPPPALPASSSKASSPQSSPGDAASEVPPAPLALGSPNPPRPGSPKEKKHKKSHKGKTSPELEQDEPKAAAEADDLKKGLTREGRAVYAALEQAAAIPAQLPDAEAKKEDVGETKAKPKAKQGLNVFDVLPPDRNHDQAT